MTQTWYRTRKSSSVHVLLSLTVLGIGLFLSTHSAFAQDAANDERIQQFRTDITLRTDGSARVEETIRYDFGDLARHGIYRDIPLDAVPGSAEPLALAGITVTDDAGAPYMFTGPTGPSLQTTLAKVLDIVLGESLIRGTSGRVFLKIGDPDTTITGPHTYRIGYDVRHAAGSFEDRDEIYWNSTGTFWQVSIDTAETHVTIPAVLAAGELHLASYCGSSGETGPCGEARVVPHPEQGTTEVVFERPADMPLLAGEGMTVAVGFPKGIVAAVPDAPNPLLEFLGYWFVVVPFIIIPILFRKRIAYYLRRRAFYRKMLVVTEFDAGDFTPLEAAALTGRGPRNADLSAELIWLAVHGYLTIAKEGSDYRFTATGKDATALRSYDQELLAGVAGKSTADLKHTFYTTAASVKKGALEAMYTYAENTPSVSSMGGVGALFLSIFLAINPGVFIWIIGTNFGYIFSATVLLWGIANLVLGSPLRLTEEGLMQERRLRGLRRYIDVAEEERIAFHSDPKRNPETFETLLPYAIIFGLEKKWALQFADLHTARPSWYADTSSANFSSVFFAASLSSFSSKTSTTLSSRPGSSGGGSSGGGGGGGGGGSW